MMKWAVTYQAIEKSRFEVVVDARSEGEALDQVRELADFAGGYDKIGIWVSTDDTDIDLDSIQVEPVELPTTAQYVLMDETREA